MDLCNNLESANFIFKMLILLDDYENTVLHRLDAVFKLNVCKEVKVY